MRIFNSDLPVHRQIVLAITPVGWAVIGFLIGYFFTNQAVYIFTGCLVLGIIVEYIDMKGREIDGFANMGSMACITVGLISLWITTLSVNHWWSVLIPSILLR
ncbi:hypothetical protein HY417_00080 [Candidatus Kaiserbacteria bacterium]|nr:hypothetical protein [Candidatus Kaiserbacteria bacterium]